MKLIPTLLLLSVSMLSLSARAADAAVSVSEVQQDSPSTERRTLLGIAVLPLQWGEFQLEGERVLSERVSVGLGLRVALSRNSNQSSDGPPNSGFETTETRYSVGVAPQVRVFLTGRAPEGFWLSPRLEVGRKWSNYKNETMPLPSGFETREWSVGGALLVGYSAVVVNGLIVQAGVGVETAHNSTRQSSSGFSLGEDPEVFESHSKSSGWSIGERMALSVGWAF